MWNDESGKGRPEDQHPDDETREPGPSLFHGDEEYDESAASVAAIPRDEAPPTGEELTEEPGHIPSQEAWLGTTTSEEESLEHATEERRPAPEALRERDE